MPTPDGRINHRDLCTGAVVTRVIGDNAVGTLQLTANLEADTWDGTTAAADDATAGWRVEIDTGDANFQNMIIRGTLNADDITTGTLSADRLAVGSVTVDKLGTGETGAITMTIGTGGVIQSTDVDPDVVINGDGSAVFKNVTVTGTITAGAGSDVDWSFISNVAIVNADITSLSADKINAGTLAASFISAGTVGVHVIKLSNSASSRIESNDGTSLIIRGDGTLVATSATITGAITATSGSLSALTVSGNITMGTGGVIRTASSGNRIELADSFADAIKFYSGHGSETLPGEILAGPGMTLELYSNKSGAGAQSSIRMITGGASTGVVSITGDTDPAANNSYDLGNSTNSWRNLYLYTLADESGNTRWDLSGALTLAGADNWTLDGDTGSDFGIYENTAIRYRIRDDDNDGYHEWFGTDGTDLMRLDGVKLAVGSGGEFGWIDDNDTWIDRPAANSIGFTVANNEGARLDANRLNTNLGTTATLALPVKTTTGNPGSPIEGDMYVNRTDNALRVYADATWRDVITW